MVRISVILVPFFIAHLQAQTWTQLNPVAQPTAMPNCAMAFDSARGQAVLFGATADRAASETWLWDGTNWTSATPANSPSPRTYHAMVWDGERREIVLFGGIGPPAEPGGAALADTWVWNGANWTRKTPTTSPPGRYAHAMAWDPVRKQVILFGGDRDWSARRVGKARPWDSGGSASSIPVDPLADPGSTPPGRWRWRTPASSPKLHPQAWPSQRMRQLSPFLSRLPRAAPGRSPIHPRGLPQPPPPAQAPDRYL